MGVTHSQSYHLLVPKNHLYMFNFSQELKAYISQRISF